MHASENPLYLGRHMLLELNECPATLLNAIPQIEEILVGLVAEVGATLISKSFHHFSPHGVSGVVVIAESHITIHTWPEHRFAAIDIFTCDHSIDYGLVENILAERFHSRNHSASTFKRGQLGKRGEPAMT